jgi:hypothetical protein
MSKGVGHGVLLSVFSVSLFAGVLTKRVDYIFLLRSGDGFLGLICPGAGRIFCERRGEGYNPLELD